MRVLLSDPFAKGSSANLEEGDGQVKKDVLSRRMEQFAAWQSVNKPEPQVGQVWVLPAREVVVTEILTHYNTPDRPPLPEPRLRWRSRPKGKTGVESISIFTQRYAPAWLPGDSPLTETLDEAGDELHPGLTWVEEPAKGGVFVRLALEGDRALYTSYASLRGARIGRSLTGDLTSLKRAVAKVTRDIDWTRDAEALQNDPKVKAAYERVNALFGHALTIDEEQLDEAVQQLRKYLDGEHQVIDHGTVGMFRVYSVVDYPVGNQSIIPVRNLHRIHGHKWATFLSRVHTVADYQRLSSDADAIDRNVFVLDHAADGGVAWSRIRANIQQASAAITGTGAPRQRDALILRDLSAYRNPLTGGGLGGAAYRRGHAIEIDSRVMQDDYGAELLAHEWGHKFFFNLPQHATKYVREWFDKNVAQAPIVQAERQRLSDRDRNFAIQRAWDSFRAEWGKWDGVFPDQYLRLREKLRGKPSEDTSAIFDVFLTPGMIGVGKTKKSFRDADGNTIRKGSSVLFLSARAVAPDAYQIIKPATGADALSVFVQTTADEIRSGVALDVKASAERNKLQADRLNYMLDIMRLPAESGEERADNFFTRESFLYSTFDEAVNGAISYLQSHKMNVHGSDLFPVAKRAVFVDDWREAAARAGDTFDPEKTFARLFASHAQWEKLPPPDLNDPSGNEMRSFVKRIGITPSDYAASNVDELWAELIAHAAMRPAEVPKPLRRLFRDVLQGNTPGPGQREKKDNTPMRFRQAAGESIVLLRGASSLLEGVDDPHVLKAVFLAGGAGSGKSFIGVKTFGDTGLRVVNSDMAFEHLMKKAGIDPKREVGSDKAQALRPRAKELTQKKEKMLTAGRVGLVIDGTGDDPEKIKRKKAELEALGYDTSMVFVDVSLDVAKRRNAERARVVPDKFLEATHAASQAAKAEYVKMFGDSFAKVTNDEVLSGADVVSKLVPKLARVAMRLIEGPVKNPIGRKWVKSQVGNAPHKALGKEPDDNITTNPKREERGHWRTMRNGSKVFFNGKDKPTKGNPHVLAAMREGALVLLDRSPFDEVKADPSNPDAYHRKVGQCPDGYHFDARTQRCEKIGAKSDGGVHVHVHMPGSEKAGDNKPKQKAPVQRAHAAPSAPASKHPKLSRALGAAKEAVVHPFHAAWDLASKPSARKELREKIVGSLKKETSETKALIGTIGKVLKGNKLTPEERTAAIAQTADLVKVAVVSFAVGHVFSGGVVKALATLASPADEVVGIAIDKPLRLLTEKVFGAAHGILPTAFYESESDPEAVLMKLIDEILDQLESVKLSDEDVLSALARGGINPGNAGRLAQAMQDNEVDLEEAMKWGNKRSRAGQIRAYKKSGRMVAQTFSTHNALGRSNAADAVIDYAREGDAAYSDDKPQSANPYTKGTPQYGGWGNGWFSAWKMDYRNGYDAARRKKPRDSNPNDAGTNAYAAWIEGWDDSAKADASETHVLLAADQFLNEVSTFDVLVLYRTEPDSTTAKDQREYIAFSSDGAVRRWNVSRVSGYGPHPDGPLTTYPRGPRRPRKIDIQFRRTPADLAALLTRHRAAYSAQGWRVETDRLRDLTASESAMNEAEGAYLLHPDYALLRVTSHRQRKKLSDAFGAEGIPVMAWKPGESLVTDRVEAMVVPKQLADKMGKEQTHPWWHLKASKLGKGYVLNPWIFGGEGQDNHGWLKKRGFKRDDAAVSESSGGVADSYMRTLLAIENALDVYATHNVPDQVARDAGKMHDAIQARDRAAVLKLVHRYMSELPKGDVTGGPKYVKPGSAAKKAIARAGLLFLDAVPDVSEAVVLVDRSPFA